MFYRVDREDRIVAVSEDWDAFAYANGGAGALGSRVLGRRLNDFLAGDTTRMYVAAAIQAARVLGRPRTLPYRCDSPHERRRFQMTLTPGADGTVTVSHALLDCVPRSPKPALAAAGWRCSQCLAVRVEGGTEWLDTAPPRALRGYEICPACERRSAGETTKTREASDGR